ncbi:DUF3800 domain-containing protein [Curtobacterium sp. NPDC087080]|uniref:DUF3800 domain-containing protein n=1 Tax=Curtobacterium sp. NPDC087080 TaxID=3363965 RepID=UPI0037F6CA07
MLVAYVDESYDRERYYVAAAIATLDQWDAVTERMTGVRRRTAVEHGTDPAIEFHGHELMGGAGSWRSLRGRHREAAGISLAVLRAALDCGVRYVLCGVDTAQLKARSHDPRTPHAVAFGHVLEQIDRYTGACGDGEQAIVVADEIATQAEHQRAFAGYQEFGTPGSQSSRLRNISSPINFACSRFADGLQVVDLAVSVHYRRERVRNPHPAARRTLAQQWAAIAPAVVHRETWPTDGGADDSDEEERRPR